MKKLKLNQLEMLVAVADAGGFGSAASELGCTQSRISHAIAELEGALATRLLFRSRTGCVPTESGHLVLAKARQILGLTDELMQAAKDGASAAGRVRIACFRSISTHLLPSALEALASEHPAIRVDIDDSHEEREDVSRAVREGRADIGIAHLPTGPGLVTHPYLSDSYVLVAPSALPLHTPLSWEQLDGVPYIQLACSGALAILERCRAAGFYAEPSRMLAADSSIVAMVRRGIGYSILPRLTVFPLPAGIRTMELPFSANREFALVTLPGTARSSAVRLVMQLICAERVVAHSDAFREGVVDWLQPRPCAAANMRPAAALSPAPAGCALRQA